jgi:tetratricopeptide (TPR) repeat protein
MRSVLELAAVPHWCDAHILAALVDDPGAPSAERWMRLAELPVIEPYPHAGAGAGKVAETTRLAIRNRLAENQRAWLTELSARAARAFEGDMRPMGRIEWIYHLLVADPERGATELENLDRSWASVAHEAHFRILSRALAELGAAGVLHGRAGVRAGLVVAERDADDDHAAGAGDVAEKLRQAARATGDARLTGDACVLVGDTALEHGDLTEAEQAFAENLAISERLAEQDPGNVSWQWELEVACSRLGSVALERGDLAAAADLFGRNLDISQRLAERDPGDAGRQRDLAAAWSCVGDVALGRGDLAAAADAFGRDLVIAQRLAELDPGNSGWQEDLGLTWNRIGNVAMERDDLDAAEEAFAEYRAIFERLAELDPANAGWQRELGVAYGWVSDAAWEKDDLDVAEQAFRLSLAIAGRLAELDPDNAIWQSDLEEARDMAGRFDG